MNKNVCKLMNLVYNVFAVEKRRLFVYVKIGGVLPEQACFFRKSRKQNGAGSAVLPRPFYP